MAGTSDHSSRSTPSRHGIRSRVAAIGGAALLAVGGATVAAPTATAAELPQSSQEALDTANGIAQSATGVIVNSGPLAGMTLYYFVWCPAAVQLGLQDPQACSF